MNIGEFISQTAERIGYGSDTIKDLLSNPELSKINLPDDFKASVNKNLLTVSEAKVNSEISQYFKGNALGSIDATIKELLDEYGLDDDSKKVITEEKSTYQRVKLFTKALAEAKEKAASAVGGEKAKLVEKITELTQKLASETDSFKKQLSAKDAETIATLTQYKLDAHFGSYDYALEGIDPEISKLAAKTAFERKLTEKGGKLVWKDGNVALVSVTDDSLPFTVDNKPVDFKTFADSVVGEAKMVKVRQQNQQQQNQNQQQNKQQWFTTDQKVVAPAAKSQVSQALADLQGQK